ncbi:MULTISPECIES: hypothetical protein [unclassified Micromonospora]|uniref:hypothetical protein n=1 Tax=unclassified Micromonospora TaxID=2617518 RepID=UPI002FF3E8D6
MAALAVGLVGAGGPAQAAVNPFTAQSLCGPGYLQIDQDPVRNQTTGARLGTVHLLYHPLTGYGCTVTVKAAYVGMPTRTQVYLAAQYLPTQTDDGNRLYAAGPTRVRPRWLPHLGRAHGRPGRHGAPPRPGQPGDRRHRHLLLTDGLPSGPRRRGPLHPPWGG